MTWDRRTSMKVVRLDQPIDASTLAAIEPAKLGINEIINIDRGSLAHFEHPQKVHVVEEATLHTAYIPCHAHCLTNIDPRTVHTN